MDKLVLITGATSGIGRACAGKFAAAGCRLIINGRNIDALDSLAGLLESEYGTDVMKLPFDVTDREAAFRALGSLSGEWSCVDVLVNNAGLALGMDTVCEGDIGEWGTMIDTNVKGLLNVTRAVLPGMVERGRGHIINIGSVAGDSGYAGGSVYCGTKAAVKAISDSLRTELVGTPIRVTNVKPGLVETNFSVVRFHGDRQKADNVYRGIKPLTGEDIADVVYYAASAPEHVQIAEILVLATNQASGTVVHREK
ncbi:MAG: SDR family NAD(P)-dependent oxidoreductase [Candidatus Cryptobacteroides sp.]